MLHNVSRVSTREGHIEFFTSSPWANDWSEYIETNCNDILSARGVIHYLETHTPHALGIVIDLHIEDEFRGAGYGKGLLRDAMAQMEEEGASTILLFANVQENNTFLLEGWYEAQGFTTIHDDEACPMMAKSDHETIQELKQSAVPDCTLEYA